MGKKKHMLDLHHRIIISRRPQSQQISFSSVSNAEYNAIHLEGLQFSAEPFQLLLTCLDMLQLLESTLYL